MAAVGETHGGKGGGGGGGKKDTIRMEEHKTAEHPRHGNSTPQVRNTDRSTRTARGRRRDERMRQLPCEKRCSIFLPILADPPVRADLSIYTAAHRRRSPFTVLIHREAAEQGEQGIVSHNRGQFIVQMRTQLATWEDSRGTATDLASAPSAPSQCTF